MEDKPTINSDQAVKPSPNQESKDSACIIESPASLFNLVEEVVRQKKKPDKK